MILNDSFDLLLTQFLFSWYSIQTWSFHWKYHLLHSSSKVHCDSQVWFCLSVMIVDTFTTMPAKQLPGQFWSICNLSLPTFQRRTCWGFWGGCKAVFRFQSRITLINTLKDACYKGVIMTQWGCHCDIVNEGKGNIHLLALVTTWWSIMIPIAYMRRI